MISFLKGNKKGNVTERIAVIGFLFIFGLSSLFGFLFFNEFKSEFEKTDFYGPEVEYVAESYLFYLKWFDYILVIIMILLVIAIAISSAKVAAAPVFFVVTFIGAVFEGAVGYFFSYMFTQITSDSVFATTVAFFPRTLLICSNMHWIALVTIIIGAITLYAKKEKGQFLS